MNKDNEYIVMPEGLLTFLDNNILNPWEYPVFPATNSSINIKDNRITHKLLNRNLFLNRSFLKDGNILYLSRIVNFPEEPFSVLITYQYQISRHGSNALKATLKSFSLDTIRTPYH